MGRESEMVTSVIYLLGLEEQDISRASDYAEVTAFAAVGVNVYSAMYFSHNRFVFSG